MQYYAYVCSTKELRILKWKVAACLHAIVAQMRRRTTAQASTCPPTRCFFLSFPVQMLIYFEVREKNTLQNKYTGTISKMKQLF